MCRFCCRCCCCCCCFICCCLSVSVHVLFASVSVHVCLLSVSWFLFFLFRYLSVCPLPSSPTVWLHTDSTTIIVIFYPLQIICFMLFFLLCELGKWPLHCWTFARCTFVLFFEVAVAAVQIEPLIDTTT